MVTTDFPACYWICYFCFFFLDVLLANFPAKELAQSCQHSFKNSYVARFVCQCFLVFPRLCYVFRSFSQFYLIVSEFFLGFGYVQFLFGHVLFFNIYGQHFARRGCRCLESEIEVKLAFRAEEEHKKTKKEQKNKQTKPHIKNHQTPRRTTTSKQQKQLKQTNKQKQHKNEQNNIKNQLKTKTTKNNNKTTKTNKK